VWGGIRRGLHNQEGSKSLQPVLPVRRESRTKEAEKRLLRQRTQVGAREKGGGGKRTGTEKRLWEDPPAEKNTYFNGAELKKTEKDLGLT